ncbi:DUF2231 domain-containing protein [Echinicola rosea]|nr:DUF2231 domain-containing protein [Echinicola rosea]
MIIHFPIVLWSVAVIADLILLFCSKSWIRNMTVTLYTMGALGGFAAYLSGTQAIDMVSVPMQGEITAGNHSDWGRYTFYFLSAYAIIRLVLFWIQRDRNRWLAVLLFILGLAGMGMVTKTADLGGKLVYKYGVGTKK